MKPYYQDKWVTIYHGDCRELELGGISAVVTDPPYELGFMGKKWDSTGVSYQVDTWRTLRDYCLQGAPLLSFGGTRTYHRITCAIEDAGWEIRDCVMWVYGSGFPKSLNIGKAVDKVMGNEREWISVNPNRASEGAELASAGKCQSGRTSHADITKGNTVWEGYGTALKPAYEPIVLAMNPVDGTFAENALKHKVAGLNIDGCRVDGARGAGVWGTSNRTIHTERKFNASPNMTEYRSQQHPKGRFPANFIHDGSQMVMELFPESSTTGNRRNKHRVQQGIVNTPFCRGIDAPEYTDSGSAARFFYCAKASKAERERGCDTLEPSQPDPSRKDGDPGGDNPRNRGVHRVHNNHPTVKPLALMEYLVKLVKMPEYNLILDPFMGSGTTLLACIKQGIPCIGIDTDEHACEIAAKRCSQEVMDFREGGQ